MHGGTTIKILLMCSGNKPQEQSGQDLNLTTLLLNFILDLLWTGRASSVSSVAFMGFVK
jgi:hypothetical protein